MPLKMVHPEVEAAGEVLDKNQFLAIYAPRGWELMDDATSFANEHLGRFVRSADTLTKDEARALIAVRSPEDYPDADAAEDAVRETYIGLFAGGPPLAAPVTESPTGVALKLFDPAEHNVTEVTDYLAGASEDEQRRIIAAEKAAGKPRKTITEWTPPEPDDDTATAAEQTQE